VIKGLELLYGTNREEDSRICKEKPRSFSEKVEGTVEALAAGKEENFLLEKPWSGI